MSAIETAATSLSSWVNTILFAMEAEGIDSQEAIHAVGIEKKLLEDPNARIETALVSKLWDFAVEQAQDDCIGLKAAFHIKPTTLHALGFALLVSNNLLDSIERMQRFYKIVSNAGTYEYSQENGQIIVTTASANQASQPSAQAFDMSLASGLLFARESLGKDISPLRVELMRSEPKSLETHQALFKCPVVFNQPVNRVFYDEEVMLRPLPTANKAIAQHNDQIVAEYLARLDTKQYTKQVHEQLINLLPGGNFSIEVLAKAMNTSPRSLHRQLQKEDIAYQDILNEVRKTLAEKYLLDPANSVTDIAFKLGYNDASNFARAFKRWSGMSPNEFKSANQST